MYWNYFTLEEFINSTVAKKLNIKNQIPPSLMGNAEYTLSKLDEIRKMYGKPITITSGYRCPELNKAVGGKPNSQHMKAEAADLKWDEDLFLFLRDNSEFDQLIKEKSKTSKWIHISFNKNNNRNQVLTLCT